MGIFLYIFVIIGIFKKMDNGKTIKNKIHLFINSFKLRHA